MMYPSGTWRGFWEQRAFGRQEMSAFELHFRPNGEARGQGLDMVGPFTFAGSVFPVTGHVTLVKQYLGKHSVKYVGQPDGEGCILGTWTINLRAGDTNFQDTGSFLMKPDLPPPTGDEPIVRLGTK